MAMGNELYEISEDNMNQEIREISQQPDNIEKIRFKEEGFAIQGANFEVYRIMGCGYLEAVYQECLEKELGVRGIPGPGAAFFEL